VKKATLVLPLLYCAAACLLAAAQPVLSADAQPSADSTPAVNGYLPVADANYRIKEEDLLRLDVWGEQQLTGVQMVVTPDGKITVPFLGQMQAEGLTQAELTEQVVKSFEAAGLFIKPQVQIAVQTLHRPRAKVLGEVRRPGDVELKDGDRLLDAIASAGSYTEAAWLQKATLLRQGSNETIPIDLKKMLAGDMSQNYELRKGDSIYIPPEDYANKIYVLGYVQRPGIYPLKDKTTVLAAISLANGPTERGALKGTVVVRGDLSKPTRVPCNLSRLFDKGDLTQDIVLQAGDVVIVPETNKPNWSAISGVLGTILNVTYLRRYGLF
jgi:polysaccharide biosynthesis/export protein